MGGLREPAHPPPCRRRNDSGQECVWSVHQSNRRATERVAMLPVFSRQIHTAVAPSLMRLDDQNTDLSADSAARSADEQLLRRYSETGSEEAFSQLVYRHAGWVYHFCRRRLNDSHLAEDATQAVFLLLARKIPTMPPPAHLAGWS